MHNAYLKTVFDSFIDKSLLKCLVFNDNVNNISSYDVIFYVTRFVAASFILPVFFVLLVQMVKKAKEIIETNLRGCNKKVIIWLRCVSRSYWHWIAIQDLGLKPSGRYG